MGAGTLACGTAELIDAQVALCGFCNRGSGHFIKNEIAVGIADVYHADIIIRAAVGAHATADAGSIIDDDLAFQLITMDGTRRTTDHAYRVYTVHTGIGYHMVADLRTMSNKARIVFVGGSAGAHTIIAPSAAVKVDYHGLRAVYKALFNEKFQHVLMVHFTRLGPLWNLGVGCRGFDRGR